MSQERVMGMSGARVCPGRVGGWRAGTAAAAALVVTGCLLSAGPAAAASVLYASASGPASKSCTSPADACSLATALGKVAAGGTVQLVTAGATAHYVGNWTVKTTGTSAGEPVTIRPASGLSGAPVLDGNHGRRTGCHTVSCAGPVLTVPVGVYVSITGVTITNGDNTTTKEGGGIQVQGSVSVSASTFTHNITEDGGAIDNDGSLSVSASTFTGNTATYFGGAIDNGDAAAGSLWVSASTLTGNTALDGGAIDSADEGGTGSVTVVASTFAGNTATYFGDVIDAGSDGGGGTVSVAADVFSGTCMWFAGAWVDAGYNAGIDPTCFGPGAATDVNAGSTAALKLGPLAHNGGPTKTIKPQPGSPVTGIIPDPTTVTLIGVPVKLCPTVDQRGESSAPSTKCDAGAVQTSAGSHAPRQP